MMSTMTKILKRFVLPENEVDLVGALPAGASPFAIAKQKRLNLRKSNRYMNKTKDVDENPDSRLNSQDSIEGEEANGIPSSGHGSQVSSRQS